MSLWSNNKYSIIDLNRTSTPQFIHLTIKRFQQKVIYDIHRPEEYIHSIENNSPHPYLSLGIWLTLE